MLFSNFTEKARIAISEAHDAAAEMGHNYIGSEHLLMGLIREGSGVAAKVLEKNGVTAEKVKDKINEYRYRSFSPTADRTSAYTAFKTYFGNECA